MDSLTDIMNACRSDKGHGHHTYTYIYEFLFDKYRDRDDVNIFEMGLGTNDPSVPSTMGVFGYPGASVKGWRKWFKKANIYGGDIDSKILFSEDGIKTYYVDQTSGSSIHNMFEKIGGDVRFDIIIDDGLHTPEAANIFLLNAVHRLKKGGIYVIEDCHRDLESNYLTLMEEWKKYFTFVSLLNIYPSYQNPYDNRLIICIK